MLYKTPEEQILDIVKKVNPKNPQEYVDNIVRSMMVSRVNEWISKCADCKFSNGIKSYTCGPANASVFIIGEGILESQQASNKTEIYPYGDDVPEGKYLSEILSDRIGVNKDDIFFVNVTNCFCHEISVEKSLTVPHQREKLSVARFS